MKINKKISLLITSSLLAVFLMSFVSASLCRGNDGYYHDCNTLYQAYTTGYVNGFYDGYKIGYNDGYYNKYNYLDYREKYPVVKKTYTTNYYSNNYASSKTLDYNKCTCKSWNRNGICIQSVCQKEYYNSYSPIRYSYNTRY